HDGGQIGGWALFVNTAGAIKVHTDSAVVTEGGTVDYSLVRYGGARRLVNLTLPLRSNQGTHKATPGSDFTMPASPILMSTLVTQTNFSIQALDDAFAERPETAYLTLTNPTGGAVLDNSFSLFALSILDNDLGVFAISPPVGVADGGTDVQLTVTNAQ